MAHAPHREVREGREVLYECAGCSWPEPNRRVAACATASVRQGDSRGLQNLY